MSTVVSTTSAPAAVGPYSQAVSTGGSAGGAGSTVYVSGQVPLDPATGALVDGGIQAQAERVLTNIGAILEAAGLSADGTRPSSADTSEPACVNRNILSMKSRTSCPS